MALPTFAPVRITIAIFLLLSSWTLCAQEQYVETTAQGGDGVLSMLRRYDLDAYSCNISEFYTLNKMERTDGLVKGIRYFLPIRRHKYNGRSIRTTIGLYDFDRAVKIQDFNRVMQKKGYRAKAYEDDLDLWVPHHLLHCPEDMDESRTWADQETLTSRSGTFPIFGEKYRRVTPISQELKGQVFYISAGHGGPDPGAMSERAGNVLCEDEYAYDVSLRLCWHLIARGAIAYMIIRDNNDGIRDDLYLKCDNDEVALGEKTIPLNQKERLYQRATIINQLFQRHKKQGVRKQTALYIHVDSNNKGLRQDVFFYHLTSSKASKAIAETIHQTFKDKYRQHQASRSYHGTVTGRDLYVLRETSPAGVYVELANIRNPEDQRRIVIPENREALAKWMAEGLVKALTP